MRILQTTVILFFLSVSELLFALQDVNFNSTREEIDQSVLFARVSDGKILYEDNPDLPLTPASIAKLFGAAALLKTFGLNYRVGTEFFHSGVNKNGEVQGDLIVVGRGDPKLVSEDLWKIVADLDYMGIKSFTGNLVLDNSFFRDAKSHDRVEKVAQNSYDSPLSALSVNFNNYELAISPSPKVGELANVEFYPYPLEGVPIYNSLKTVSSQKRENLEVTRVLKNGKDFIEVRGNIRVSSPLIKIHRSASQAFQLTGRTLKAFLKGRGIQLKGDIKEGLLENYKNKTKLFSYKGQAMSTYVDDFLAYSNNFMIDMLINLLGASSGMKGDTYEMGMKSLDYFTSKKSFPGKGFYLEKASGLSNKSRMSARQMVSFLSELSKEDAFFPNFLANITVPQTDGTLKKRFQFQDALPYQKMIRAKTGTLLTPVSVSSLAGYLLHPTGLIAFAVIQNGKVGKKNQANIINLRKAVDLGVVQFLKKYEEKL